MRCKDNIGVQRILSLFDGSSERRRCDYGIAFAALIATAAASGFGYAGVPLAYSHAAPVAYAGGYKQDYIIPQAPIIKKFARTEVVGVAPIEHGLTVKHYSGNPAGFGYSQQSYGIHGVRKSDSFIAQPPHRIEKTIEYAAPIVHKTVLAPVLQKTIVAAPVHPGYYH
ncbi:unnamed protein product [Notodromas monacha]|uniref:Uncharacterized protein n=1 Tax=Notodromas monacha TaxID=399045 RepID=A0A7R9BI10_9CRUS|nr:unnamed protein product [Notodromas monacha]CAG0915876.1 unnamed protein product [Notodromas monacha]